MMNYLVYACFTAHILWTMWLFFRSDSRILAKTVTSLAGICLVLLLSSSFPTWAGWPAGHPVWHKEYKLLATVISEDPEAEDYVWLVPVTPEKIKWWNAFAYKASDGTPRAYAVPGSKDRKDQLKKASAALKKGMNVTVKFGDKPGDASGEGSSGGDAVGGKSQGGRDQTLNGRQIGGGEVRISAPEAGPKT